jgi:signal transduction histidine kinase
MRQGRGPRTRGRGDAAGRARLERAAAAGDALIALAEAASAGLSPGEVLARVTRTAATLAPAATAYLWRTPREGGELRLAVEAGPGRAGGAEPIPPGPEVGEDLARVVAESPEPVIVVSLRQDRRLADQAWVRARGFVSFAGVRFARGDRLLGVLALYTPRRHRFTRQEVSLLRAFAAHAAAAIENALLFETASRRLARLSALTEIGREISQERDPDVLLSLISRRATELLGGDSASVFLFEPATGRLRPQASFNDDEIDDVALGPGEGLCGAVALRREGILVNDYPRSPYAIMPFRERDWAVLAQPLVHGDALYGVLIVRRRGTDGARQPFTDDDLTQLGDFAVQAAIALESARRLRLADARAERVKAAAEVGQLLASTRDAGRILDLVAEKFRDVLGAEAFGLFRPDSAGRLRYVRGFGLDDAFMREHTLGVGEGVVGRAAAERRAVETVDILQDPAIPLSPAARARIERVGSRGIVAVPMLSPDGVLGVLATYHPVGVRVPPEEVEFLETLANHAGAALESARLLGESRRHAARLEWLSQVNRAVSASLQLDEVLGQIVRAAAAFLDAPLANLWIADEGRRVLVRRAGYGDPGILAGVPDEIAYGQGGAGWVAEHRIPIVDIPAETDPRILGPELLLARGIHAFSGFPVLLGDRLLGVLVVGRTGAAALSPEDLALLQALLGQAAIAVENARLYEAATAAYHELETAQEQLVLTEKLRALGEMASGVAHDFNNLLAAILGRVQLIQRQVTDPALGRWLGVIEQAALDGAQTVRQIQEFTRVRRDQPTETVDVNQVVRDAVEMTRPRWHGEPRSRGVDVRLTLVAAPVPPVDGHPAELREVLTNLILNAVDALPAGGTITIDTRPAGEHVEIRVTDSGLGMSDTVRRRIFEPFFSTKGPKGTGLGLAMVYGIVSRHGGEVRVESEEGAGSTFTVRLPVGQAAAARPAPAPALVPGTAGLRVLVIDDEPYVRDILGDMLRHDSHRVVVAEHGTAGLERFQAEPFDLVLTDLAMPGMSGWQVAQAVKALRPEVPVVLVTGWGVEVPSEQLRQSGVDRVMSKPFRYADVQEVVASIRGQALHS